MVFLKVNELIWLKNALFTAVANDPLWKDYTDATIEMVADDRRRKLIKEKNSFEEIKEEVMSIFEALLEKKEG